MTPRIEAIIEDLKGTCRSMSDACNSYGCEFDDLTTEELEDLDNEIFCCDTCGWWCEISDMCDDGENNCRDCAE